MDDSHFLKFVNIVEKVRARQRAKAIKDWGLLILCVTILSALFVYMGMVDV